MKLKAIRNNLEKARNQGNEQEKQKMFFLLQQRYNEEIKKDPNSDMCLRVIDAMKQYNCPMTVEQSKLDKSASIKVRARTDHSSNAHKLGAPFTNPYSFIPFSSKAPSRKEPTPRTIGEVEERYSGILQMKVNLNSPLLSPEAEAINADQKDAHKSYRALTIDDSVIYPATGVRGALRNLMTVITGGSLRYLDNEMFLCDGRWETNSRNEKNLQLGCITKVGNRNRSGTIVLGSRKSLRVEKLEKLFSAQNEKLNDHRDDRVIWVKCDSDLKDIQFAFNEKKAPAGYDRMLKLSGRPVGSRDKVLIKKEWVFTPNFDREITIPPEIWVEYQSRYLHGPHDELKTGNLLWIEPFDEGNQPISHGGEVQSIQWAKWGKEGDRLRDRIPETIKPDYSIGSNNLVDEVTNLFGQVCPDKKYIDKAPAFSGRIRPDNAVFRNAIGKLKKVTLSPLQPPHPGCKAFYRENSLTNIKGYKVYRTTNEKGNDAPHHYERQPVLKKGLPQEKYQKINKTVELLSADATGLLSISFNALSKREYALLRLICSLPQRFGGGKPFGLGSCSLELVAVKNEFGKIISDPVPNWQTKVTDLKERVALYNFSQQPVDKLRYPQAVSENGHTITRAGHVWFSKNAGLGQDKYKLRSKPVKRDSSLYKQIGSNRLDPQPLPELTLEPDGDLLYGYDLMFRGKSVYRQGNHKIEELTDAVPFEPDNHIKSHHSSGRNTSPNRETRQKQRQDR